MRLTQALELSKIDNALGYFVKTLYNDMAKSMLSELKRFALFFFDFTKNARPALHKF